MSVPGAPGRLRAPPTVPIASPGDRAAVPRNADGGLLGHGAHYLVGELGAKGLAFLFFLVLARVLAPTEFGALSLYVTVTAMTAGLVSLGLPKAILRFYFREPPFAETLGTSLALMLACSVLMAALIGLGLGSASAFLDVPPTLLLVAAVGGPAIAIRDTWLSSLRARKLSRKFAATQVVEVAIYIALVLGLWVGGRDLRYSTVAVSYTGASVAVVLFALGSWARAPGLAWSPSLVRPLLGFSLPLVLHGLAMWALTGYDQIVINQLLGTHATGVYAFGYRFGMSMIIVSTAFSAAWMPEFLDKVRSPEGRGELDALARRYGGLLIVLSTALMLLLPPVAWWFGGEEYRDAIPVIGVVVYGYLWFMLYTFVVGYAMHHGRTRSIAIGTIGAMIVNVGLNYLVVGRFGIMGAALVTVLSYMLLFIFQYLAARPLGLDIRYRWLVVRVVAVSPLPALVYLVVARL